MSRFLFVTNSTESLANFRLPVMRALRAAGHDVVAASPPGRHEDRLAAAGIIHRKYDLDRWGLNPWHDLSAMRQLAMIVTDNRPDLVHAFMAKPNIYTCMVMRTRLRTPVVCSVTGLGSVYCGGNGKALPTLLDHLYRLTLRRADRVVFQNPDDRAHFREHHLIGSGKARLIHGSGVDLARFRPVVRHGRSRCTVIMVARLIHDKGVREYLAAAATLQRKWGDRVRFLLVGDDDSGNPGVLHSSIQQRASTSSSVELLGYREDIPALLAESDIYCLPSYREGLPVSTLEALASGLPVVTTTAVGCRETVSEGRNGLLVEPRNSTALAAALDRLIGDAGLRHRFGDASRRRAEDQFGQAAIVAAHLQLYRELLPDLAANT